MRVRWVNTHETEQCLAHTKGSMQVTNYKGNKEEKLSFLENLWVGHPFCLHTHPSRSRQEPVVSLHASEQTISQANLPRIPDFTDDTTSSEELNDLSMNTHIRVYRSPKPLLFPSFQDRCNFLSELMWFSGGTSQTHQAPLPSSRSQAELPGTAYNQRAWARGPHTIWLLAELPLLTHT